MSCFFIPKLTFTLCLKTRQSICCLWGSKVSSIQLIIYMTFRKSGSDLLSSFCPLCSLSPVPSQTVNGEFITSSHQLYSGWKEFIFHLLLYITATVARHGINILLHWCRRKEKLEILPEFLSSPLTSCCLSALQSDETLTSDDELIGHWPLPPDISIQSGLTCCDTRQTPHHASSHQ